MKLDHKDKTTTTTYEESDYEDVLFLVLNLECESEGLCEYIYSTREEIMSYEIYMSERVIFNIGIERGR